MTVEQTPSLPEVHEPRAAHSWWQRVVLSLLTKLPEKIVPHIETLANKEHSARGVFKILNGDSYVTLHPHQKLDFTYSPNPGTEADFYLEFELWSNHLDHLVVRFEAHERGVMFDWQPMPDEELQLKTTLRQPHLINKPGLKLYFNEDFTNLNLLANEMLEPQILVNFVPNPAKA